MLLGWLRTHLCWQWGRSRCPEVFFILAFTPWRSCCPFCCQDLYLSPLSLFVCLSLFLSLLFVSLCSSLLLVQYSKEVLFDHQVFVSRSKNPVGMPCRYHDVAAQHGMTQRRVSLLIHLEHLRALVTYFEPPSPQNPRDPSTFSG